MTSRASSDAGGEFIHPAMIAAAIGAIAARDPAAAPPLPDAPVPRDRKIALLERLMALGGPEAVLEAGQRLREMGDPLLAVLANSDAVDVVLGKIAGLNRYFHSNHRHEVVETGANHLILDHVSGHGAPPLAIESLFTCGLYVALLEEIGCEGLACAFPVAGATGAAVWRDGQASGIPRDGYGRWRFTWTGFRPRRVLPGIDRLVMEHLPPDLAGRTLAARIGEVLAADLARKWRIPDIAARLALSPRSLQRRLAEEGTSFSRLLADARIGHAKTLLSRTGEPITTIGYICGFADTAHFTRSFKAATRMAPSAWRTAATAPDAR